jgi:hypothetical protein
LDARLAECSTHDAASAAPAQLNRHSARHAKAWNERGGS